MAAYRYHLDNLVVIIDNNGLQIDGTTDEIMPQLDLTKKFDAFGYDTYEIDGHNMEQIMETFDKIHAAKDGRPKFINAHTERARVCLTWRINWLGTVWLPTMSSISRLCVSLRRVSEMDKVDRYPRWPGGRAG